MAPVNAAAVGRDGPPSAGGVEFRCLACACALDFSCDVGPTTTNANATSLDESFVVLAPELATRERRRQLPGGGFGGDGSMRSPPGRSRVVDAHHRAGAMGESFVMLPNGDASECEVKASVLAKIFDVASDLSGKDHPLCETCSLGVLREVRRKTAEAEAECARYEETLERLREANEEEESAPGALTNAVKDLEKSEAEAMETINALKLELASTRTARNNLAKKAAALDEAEDHYWREFHTFKKNLHAHLEKRDSILSRIEQAQNHINRLEKTNVFNDAFHIWTDGAFGTINGFRLGRLPNVAVEWDEINVAFGLSCLLLHSMARICKFTFTQYTLKPMGSFPKVLDSKGNVYELFGPVSIISSHKYDKALLGFLTCLSELSEFMRAKDVRQGVNPAFELPFAISGDKIDGKKVSFTFNRDENWTYALKLCLTDLKLMLAWLSHKD